jgi:hypothetical protein
MREQRRLKWRLLAPLGLAAIGMGTAIAAEASTWKRDGDQRWFWLGTAGLCLLNSGVALFGEAVKQRALLDADLQRMSQD